MRHISLVKGLKGLSIESPTIAQPIILPAAPLPPPKEPLAARSASDIDPPPVPPKDRPPSQQSFQVESPISEPGSRANTLSSIDTTSWDVVDDLPLRWATDFVPLAQPGSRLANAAILFFEVFKGEQALGRTMLAIATKASILLYETPQGTRAFRFVKASISRIFRKTFAHKLNRNSGRLYLLGASRLLCRYRQTIFSGVVRVER